jgi:hypothetical protein
VTGVGAAPGRRSWRRRISSRLGLAALVTALSCAGWASVAPTARAATLPVLSMGAAGLLEGNSGTRTIWVPATLSAASSATVSAHYATASKTATSGSDFTAASGTLTFPAGTTSRYVPVTVHSDTTVEPDELFTVTISALSGATTTQSVGYGNIMNDDSSNGVRIGVGNATIVEGYTGTRTLGFTATLSVASTATVSVHYATASGTATSGSDFIAASGTLTFAPGVTSRFVPIVVYGDTKFETN